MRSKFKVLTRVYSKFFGWGFARSVPADVSWGFWCMFRQFLKVCHESFLLFLYSLFSWLEHLFQMFRPPSLPAASQKLTCEGQPSFFATSFYLQHYALTGTDNFLNTYDFWWASWSFRAEFWGKRSQRNVAYQVALKHRSATNVTSLRSFGAGFFGEKMLTRNKCGRLRRL